MRTSLLLGFGAVLLLTAVGILFNNLYAGRKVMRTLSTSLLRQTTSLAEMKLDAFFGTISTINSGTAMRLKSGVLTWGDWDGFRRFVRPLLHRVPQISGVGAGDSEGNAYNLMRQGTNWLSQEIRPSEWGRQTLWKEWGADGVLLHEWWEESDFDPRTRPWFTGALSEASADTNGGILRPFDIRPFWTAPYRFFTTGEFGLTVATQVPWTNQLDAVVYFDVRLADLDAFTVQSAPSSNGFTIVLSENSEVVGWPGQGELTRERVLSGEGGVEVAVDKLPLLSQAIQYWQEMGRPEELFDRVKREGHVLWLATRTIPNAGTTFQVLVVVPQEDLVGEVRKERQRMALVLAVGLAGSLGLAFWLSSVYTRPLSALVERSQAIQRLELERHPNPVSRIGEVHELSTAQMHMCAALESFGRYVPKDVISELMKQGEAAKIGAHPAELTVFFSDIRSFTAISERMAPGEIARYLSEYFNHLHQIIERHQGTTDKFVGDAIMAFWGAPKQDSAHALHAVEAALDAGNHLKEMNRIWEKSGRPALITSFGLAAGPMVVGNVGAETRLNYTVLGNTVNVASRLVGLSRELGCEILASETVRTATDQEIEWRRVGLASVRGVSKPLMACEPLGRRGHVGQDALAFKASYELALDTFVSRQFSQAASLSEGLLRQHPDNLSVQALARRCQEAAARGDRSSNTEMLAL